MSHTLDRVRAEARAWYEENWRPDDSLAAWWSALARSGWGFPTWPTWAHGRGLSAEDAKVAFEERRRVGAIGPPSGIASTLAGPTLIAHGSDEQRARFLPDIVMGRVIWCQLFSEPGAGSDLAGLRTRAVRDGDQWVVNGQKVWTSGAHLARWGILIARTDPHVPKHRGITYFVLDMHQPGVEVRRLREMTGRAIFNEVFLTDAVVPATEVIGEVGDGWRVALTTLAHERSSLGAGSLAEGGSIIIGRPDPSTRVGDLAAARRGRGEPSPLTGGGHGYVIDLARRFGRQHDPVVRQELARAYIAGEIGRMTSLRAKAAAEAGRRPGPEASIGKLAASINVRHLRDTALRIIGPHGTLHHGDAPDNGRPQEMCLGAPVLSIGGGTDEIQRNILGERVLGLPGDIRVDKDVPFSALAT